MCREAMPLAKRNDEKILLLEALVRIASPDALAVIVAQLDTPGLKDPASMAAVVLGESIVAAHPKSVAEAMQRVLQATQNADMQRRAQQLLALAKQTERAP